jgi:hypothetical protein
VLARLNRPVGEQRAGYGIDRPATADIEARVRVRGDVEIPLGSGTVAGRDKKALF